MRRLGESLKEVLQRGLEVSRAFPSAVYEEHLRCDRVSSQQFWLIIYIRLARNLHRFGGQKHTCLLYLMSDKFFQENKT